MLRRLIGEDVRSQLAAGSGPVAGQGGPVPDGPDPDQPVRQLPAMPSPTSAESRSRRENVRSTRPTAPITGLRARGVRAAGGQRRRLRHGRGDADRIFRAVLHDQGHGQGHRPGAGHRLRHRQAEQRFHQRLQRAGPGDDVHDLPAPPFGQGRAGTRATGGGYGPARTGDRPAGGGRAGQPEHDQQDAREAGLHSAGSGHLRGKPSAWPRSMHGEIHC